GRLQHRICAVGKPYEAHRAVIDIKRRLNRLTGTTAPRFHTAWTKQRVRVAAYCVYARKVKHIERQIQDVHTQIDERAAARHLLIAEPTATRDPRLASPRRVDVVDFAQLPTLHNTAHPLNIGTVAEVISHHQAAVIAFSSSQHFLSLSH